MRTANGMGETELECVGCNHGKVPNRTSVREFEGRHIGMVLVHIGSQDRFISEH